MSETIRPALTPEAWAEELAQLRANAAAGVPLWRLMGGIAQRRGPYAAAALALHSQPYGFTWEDVDVLHRVIPRLSRAMPEAGTCEDDDVLPIVADAFAIGALADRIAALLRAREST